METADIGSLRLTNRIKAQLCRAKVFYGHLVPDDDPLTLLAIRAEQQALDIEFWEKQFKIVATKLAALEKRTPA
jgi:hypothetical protein